MAHDNYVFYGLMIERCKNDNLRKLAGYGSCKDNKYIDELINSHVINFDILDHYPDVLNYKNPYQKYFYSLNSLLYKNSFIANELTFNPVLIKTNYGIVFDSSKTQYTYVFDENVRITNNRHYELYDDEGNKIYDENGNVKTESSDLVSTFTLYLGNRLQHYERSYQKLQDLLSKIGGFGKTTFIIISTLNMLVYKFIVVLGTEDFLLSINKNVDLNNNNSEYNATYENKQIFHNIKNSSIIKIDQQLNNELSIIKQRMEDNKNITNTKDGSLWNNNNTQNTFIKDDNFIKPYQLTEEFLNKPNKKSNFCWFQYIWHMICCVTTNKNIAYYENFRKRIISEENIIISHSNLYKVVNFIGLDNNKDLIFDKQYTTIFY